MSVQKLIAGNWKMHGTAASLEEARAVVEALKTEPTAHRVAICPPSTLIERMARIAEGSPVEIGAQDCHAEACGAFTGDVCGEMLHDAGARLVILGHSERRAGYQESSALVAAKAKAALRAGLEPIVCVGETLDERNAGRAEQVVEAQVRGSLPDELAERPFAVAYEPVWAIGTGLTPTLDQIAAVHGAIRDLLTSLFGGHGARMPILYGGSVKPQNAGEILRVENVGGALVGGASLKAADFLPIIRAA